MKMFNFTNETKTCHSNLRFYSLLILIIMITANAPAQDFTKITTGEVANDVGDSWGCSWADYNGDGILDLFVSNVVNDFLYLGTGDSVFTKVNAGSVVADSLDSRGSCWGDYDNDGDADLFVSAGTGNNLLYRNDGNGILTKTTSGIIVNDGGTSRGCAWGDYDNDGKLDLYVANVGNDFLYHNDGGGNFTKILSGPIVTAGGSTIGCNWVDYNNDGFIDLYAVNFSGSSFLFKNNGNSTFTQVTAGAIVTDVSSATGGSWGDYDNDGDLDLIVANGGNQGNYFYKNNGAPDFTFTKDASSAITTAGDSYGSSWGDYDNDGDLDLFIANRGGQNEYLFSNSGAPLYTFSRITTGALVNDAGGSYGTAVADYDNDGDIDIFICNKFGEKNSLFENNGNNNKWINIICIGALSNKSGIGARIRVKANVNGSSVWQMQEITDQSGYYCQNSLNAEFGFGNTSVIDSLVIIWPGGQTDVHTNVAVNKFYTAVQGQTIVGVNNENVNFVSGYKLFQNYPNPFNPVTHLEFGISKLGFVSLKVYDVLGNEVTTLVNETKPVGRYEVDFDGTGLSSGIYFYKLITDGFIDTKRMILLK